MKKLSNIREYVELIANIISSIVNMHVLICDRELKIIGDADHKGIPCEEIEILSDHSVSNVCMREKRKISYIDAKEENIGCRGCSKRDTCDTTSIVAVPMMDGDEVIGSISLYNSNGQRNEFILEKKEYLYDFLEQLSSLMVLKLKDEERAFENKVMRKNMEDTINAIPYAIVNVDREGKVRDYNKEFKKRLCEDVQTGESLYDLIGSIGDEKFVDFIKNKGDTNERQFALKVKNRYTDYDVVAIPTVIEDVYGGTLFTFQKASEIYEKANKIYTHISASSFDEIIRESRAIKDVINQAKQFAKSPSTILISRESGTGKEVLASAIHCESDYASGPFVAVNCAAIPDNLLESELFGYGGGTFTGASKGGKIGKFELADKGTIFLDEIGELPIHLQPKLLRILQDRKVQRLGTNTWKKIDVRIIVATNRNLKDMINTNEFREDLFYRLSVIPIHIPPIRNRKADIRPLIDYFLKMYSNMLEKQVTGLTERAMETLMNYDWPGNVRELQNAIEYGINRTETKTIDDGDLPQKFKEMPKITQEFLPKQLWEIEKEMIEKCLDFYKEEPNGKEKVAVSLGISRATLYRKIKEYEL